MQLDPDPAPAPAPGLAPPAVRGKGGAPKKDLAHYLNLPQFRNEFLAFDAKMSKDELGNNVKAVRCTICISNTPWRCLESNTEKLKSLTGHIHSNTHIASKRSHAGYSFHLLEILFQT